MCELESFLNSCQAFFSLSSFPLLSLSLHRNCFADTQGTRKIPVRGMDRPSPLSCPSPGDVCCPGRSCPGRRGTGHPCRGDSGCGNQAATAPLPHERKSRLDVTQSDFFEGKSCRVKWVFPFSSFHARIAQSHSKRETFTYQLIKQSLPA